MHVSGIALRIEPNALAETLDALRENEALEFHHLEAATGTAIATLERRTLQDLIDAMHRVENASGVICADVAYHAFEDATDLDAPPSNDPFATASEETR